MSDEVETPAKVASLDVTEQHRTKFNLETFGIDNNGAVIDESKAPKKESKSITQEEWGAIVNCLLKWKTEAQLAVLSTEEQAQYKAFKEEHIREWNAVKEQFNKWKNKYAVEEGVLASGAHVKRLVRIEPRRDQSKPRRLVIPMLEKFDVLKEYHNDKLLHMGTERTHTAISKEYYSISQDDVRSYVKWCYHCNQKQPVIRETKGAKKPIVSYEFRDRFQVDLIDMQKKKRKNVYGVTQRWIMTLKDHATGLTVIRALPRKQAKYVVHELAEQFGLIGYPRIFHTDNGKEFVADLILKLLQETNPNISSVTGRPRTPRDQGSVESMNKLIKKVIAMLESEAEASGKSFNWANNLGRVMSVVNNQHGRGRYAGSAYEATFCMEYDILTRSKCTTIEERLRDNVDDRFEKVAKELYYMEGEGHERGLGLDDDEENAYWDGDDVSVESNEGDAICDVESAVSAAVEKAITDGGGIMIDAGSVEKISQIELKSNGGEVLESESKCDGAERKLEFSKECSKEDTMRAITTPIKQATNTVLFTKARQCYPIDQAWQNGKCIKATSKGGRGGRSGTYCKQYNFVHPYLYCQCCCWGGSLMIPCGDEAYLNDCENTKRWWDTDFISSFSQLVAHESHIDAGLKCNDDEPMIPTVLIHCHYPNSIPQESECRDLDPDIERIISILHDVDHFATVEISLVSRTIVLYDGLNRSLLRWQNHIINILKRCKLIDREVQSIYQKGRISFIYDQYRLIYNQNETEMSWIVNGHLGTQQRDTYNCGPIACMKVMELYKCIDYTIMDEEVRSDVAFYRHIIVEKFRRMTQRFNDELNLSIPVEVFDLISPAKDNNEKDMGPNVDCFCFEELGGAKLVEMPCCKKIMHMICLAMHASNSALCAYCRAPLDEKQFDLLDLITHEKAARCTNTEDETTSKRNNANEEEVDDKTLLQPRKRIEAKNKAMEKKRKHQAQSHERMIRWRKDEIEGMDISPGAVVTIKVSSKVVSHSRGVIGIVLSAKKETGGVLVVCKSGLICKTEKLLDYWIPYDEYSFKASANESCPMSNELNQIRSNILSGRFDATICKRTTILKAHQEIVGASSPCIKKRCGCRNGKCGGNCGCKRSNPPRKCHSGCACNGNCAKDDSDSE